MNCTTISAATLWCLRRNRSLYTRALTRHMWQLTRNYFKTLLAILSTSVHGDEHWYFHYFAPIHYFKIPPPCPDWYLF